MNDAAVTIASLRLTGPEKEPALLEFGSRLNVVFGPSDTGKTFVFQCLDFMLGGSKQPKEIPETSGYDTLHLELRLGQRNRRLTVQRALQGGDYRVRENATKDVVLKGTHITGRSDTLSWFLLEATGLEGKKVRTNKLGQTRELSFRDVARLILVDEKAVIGDGSPYLSGQVVNETAEKAVLRLLLSGSDDSAVVYKGDPKIVRGRKEGGLEVLRVLLEGARRDLAALAMEGDSAAWTRSLEDLESALARAAFDLAAEEGALAEIEAHRKKAWAELRKIESRKGILAGLQTRFVLLRDHYSSDLLRLDAIADAGSQLQQLKEEKCPVCGASPEHHQRERHDGPSPAEVVDACRAEAAKIRGLGVDLESTLADNAREVSKLAAEAIHWREEVASAEADLRTHLSPRLQAAAKRLREGQAERDRYRQALALVGRTLELEMLQGATSHQPPQKSQMAESTPRADDVEELSKAVEHALSGWQLPGTGRVVFSEGDFDFVVSGRRRASHGKGVRAITHAASTLALLTTCRRRGRPHPGFVAIDSPLVVYRQPDPGEPSLTADVKDAFYRSLAHGQGEGQVIIFENEEPPGDLASTATLIRFTGTPHGRSGFIPTFDWAK